MDLAVLTLEFNKKVLPLDGFEQDGTAFTKTLDIAAREERLPIAVTIDPGERGQLEVTASIEAPAGFVDPQLENNSVTLDAGSLTPVVNFEVTVSSGPTWVPGTRVTYTVTVHSKGPSSLRNVTLTNTFDPPRNARIVESLPGSIAEIRPRSTDQFKVVAAIVQTAVGNLSYTAKASSEGRSSSATSTKLLKPKVDVAANFIKTPSMRYQAISSR